MSRNTSPRGGKKERRANVNTDVTLEDRKDRKNKKVKKKKQKTARVAFPESVHGLAAAGEGAHFAEIGYENGFTQGIGDFNFVKATASIRVPCALNRIEKTYEWCRKWVEKKLDEEFRDIEDNLEIE